MTPLPPVRAAGFVGLVQSVDQPPAIPDIFLDDADQGEVGKTAPPPEPAPAWLADAMARLTNPIP